ncbi:MAG: hypothetical protein R2724_33105 [Bryobacterales bacterium]
MASTWPFGTVMVNVPQLVTMTTDLSAGTTVSRAAGMTLNWTGGTADDIVVIHGRVYAVPANVVRPIQNPLQYRSHAFVCTVTASNGSFAIPSYVLQNSPDGMLQLNVTHMLAAGVARFEATGLDLGGVMRWIDTTTYLDLEVVP